jgi:ribonucleoside-diphosphate reductase alpha chain
METYVGKGGLFSITIDKSRDALLTDMGRATMEESYLQAGESYQEAFARVATYYADDAAHAQRLYDYISGLWFMPATPVLSNGGTDHGLPISCYLSSTDDSLTGIVGLWQENAWLAAHGGGIGSYWGALRSIGETIGGAGKTSGIIPFIKVMDSQTLAISQGSKRRGSAAVYLDIAHPEIEEFLEIRKLTGGDQNRKCPNTHIGVCVPDDFMKAVAGGLDWELRSPKTGEPIKIVSARELWSRLLTMRMETGEPYILFIDRVNDLRPQIQKDLGLMVRQSNLCIEITLPTGRDHLDRMRTAVCCLSSINLLFWDRIKPILDKFVEDVLRFLDNVMSDFIARASKIVGFENAVYSASRERSVGLGVMGFHSYLQSKDVPFESAVAKSVNMSMFRAIKQQADRISRVLAEERGPCPDAADVGVMERFSNKMAIAPTASISIICGGSSPGIEPEMANAFTHKTKAGNFLVRNPFLERLLESRGQNTKEVWSSILANKGSVQHLDFLDDHEKDVFKTAFEMDQRWIVEHAADRTPFVCQSQSVNLFVPGDIRKFDLHALHWMAWKRGLKSLYYCRSMAVQRADAVSERIERQTMNIEAPVENANNFETCLACQ